MAATQSSQRSTTPTEGRLPSEKPSIELPSGCWLRDLRPDGDEPRWALETPRMSSVTVLSSPIWTFSIKPYIEFRRTVDGTKRKTGFSYNLKETEQVFFDPTDEMPDERALVPHYEILMSEQDKLLAFCRKSISSNEKCGEMKDSLDSYPVEELVDVSKAWSELVFESVKGGLEAESALESSTSGSRGGILAWTCKRENWEEELLLDETKALDDAAGNAGR